MRFVVLFFGFFGVLMTGFMGGMFLMAKEFLDLLHANQIEFLDFFANSPTGVPHPDTGMFLMGAAMYGLLGVVLAFVRCGRQGALMLLLPVLVAGLMNPFSLAFTGLQAFAALLSFFVFPLPLEESSDTDEDDEEEEEKSKAKSKPKPKPKRKSYEDDED